MDLVLLPIADHRREEQKTAVSILILMDLVLLRAKSMEYLENKERFNPYFNGSSTSTD